MGLLRGVGFAVSAIALACCAPVPEQTLTISPQSLLPTHEVSERYLSYNIEMAEVTGGRFWRPYSSAQEDERYEYRPPIDLTNPRLRTLAAGLGPAYVRVSGTWANATYFADTDTPPTSPPEGFAAVLTRDQWRGVVEFASATDAEIVISFAGSAGARDSDGLWRPDNAAQWMRYTQSVGGHIGAAEFLNEPNMAAPNPEMNVFPEGYTARDFVRDNDAFNTWMKTTSPETLVLSPGVAMLTEPTYTLARFLAGPVFSDADLMASATTRPDAVSFHFYGGSSQRCKIPLFAPTEAGATSDQWLGSIDGAINKANALRDAYAAGAPVWLTETAEAACGGDPWASTFIDTFRFTDQAARSARMGVFTFMHNTLAASDYGMLDEDTFAPRPNYWAAYLWRSLMGTTVLDAGDDAAERHVYGHCLRNSSGGVVLLAINPSGENSQSVTLNVDGELHTLEAGSNPTETNLNGTLLSLGAGDALPALEGVAFQAGAVQLPPRSISYLVMETADNPACR